MATSPTGRRFSDRENTQTGSKNSRAVTRENLTNKNDRLPSGRADLVKDIKEDVRKMRTDSSSSTGAARASQEAARSRATSRMVGRAGAAGAALSTGLEIGRALGEAGGYDLVDKAIEKSGVGKKIDEAAVGERVKLSEESKKRIEAGETKDKGNDERVNKEDYPTYQKDTKSAAAFREAYKNAKDDDKSSFTFEGRKYSTDSKEYKKGGIVTNKGIGASMKPHNVFNSKGKK